MKVVKTLAVFFLTRTIIPVALLSLSTHSFAELSCKTIFSKNTGSTTTEAQKREDFALRVIKSVEFKEKNNTNTVQGWLKEIIATQNNAKPSIIEHTSLAYIYNSGILRESSQLKEALQNSYYNLTGKALATNNELAPLPSKLLKTATVKEQLFHDEIFFDAVLKPVNKKEASPKRFRLPPIKKLKRHINIINITTVILSVAALNFESGRAIFAGALVGLAGASFNEYLVHIGVGHAPESIRKHFRKLGKVGKFLDEITLTHHVHHLIVSKRFAADDLPPETQERADLIVQKLVAKFVERRFEEADGKFEPSEKYWVEVERLIGKIKAGNYGINGTKLGVASMITSALPFYLGNIALYGATGSVEFLLASTVSLTGWITQSLYSHRYMHIAPEDLSKAPNTTRLQRWYIKSPVGQLQTRLHFVHHGTPWDYQRTRNGIIMAFSVADRLLKGVKYPSLETLLEMNEEGLLGD